MRYAMSVVKVVYCRGCEFFRSRPIIIIGNWLHKFDRQRENMFVKASERQKRTQKKLQRHILLCAHLARGKGKQPLCSLKMFKKFKPKKKRLVLL